MISISTTIFDCNGSVVFDDSADIRENVARVSRIKTLDGGVVINNSGFSDGDMTVGISSKISEVKAKDLWHIFKNYTSINFSTEHGFFLGSIKTLKINNGRITMSILIAKRDV